MCTLQDLQSYLGRPVLSRVNFTWLGRDSFPILRLGLTIMRAHGVRGVR